MPGLGVGGEKHKKEYTSAMVIAPERPCPHGSERSRGVGHQSPAEPHSYFHEYNAATEDESTDNPDVKIKLR